MTGRPLSPRRDRVPALPTDDPFSLPFLGSPPPSRPSHGPQSPCAVPAFPLFWGCGMSPRVSQRTEWGTRAAPAPQLSPLLLSGRQGTPRAPEDSGDIPRASRHHQLSYWGPHCRLPGLLVRKFQKYVGNRSFPPRGAARGRVRYSQRATSGKREAHANPGGGGREHRGSPAPRAPGVLRGGAGPRRGGQSRRGERGPHRPSALRAQRSYMRSSHCL